MIVDLNIASLFLLAAFGLKDLDYLLSRGTSNLSRVLSNQSTTSTSVLLPLPAITVTAVK